MLGLRTVLSGITDARVMPQIPVGVITRSVLLMFLCRLGSLNSLEQLKDRSRLIKLLGDSLPSADSLGRVFDLIDSETVRESLYNLYLTLKRKKMLQPPAHGMVALVIDGHESHATYRRHCDGCLERQMLPDAPNYPQFYHRNVTAQLVFKNFRLLIDAEPQHLGENELSCAHRLLDRVLRKYSRAFDVVVMDAIYANSKIFSKLIDHNKHGIAVLKDNAEQIMRVAQAVIAEEAPSSSFIRNRTTVDCWDFTRPWLLIGQNIRVVATREQQPAVKSQRTGIEEIRPPSSWSWLTTITRKEATSELIVEIAHRRWAIENEGFNELANHWHADHVYRHAPTAITNFWLFSMLAYNIFRAFFNRNLKAAARQGKTMLHFARLVSAEVYALPALLAGIPP